MRRYLVHALLALVLLLASCAPQPAASPQVEGRIILWHAWQGAEAEALDALIARFVAIYPRAHIVRSAVPPGQIAEDYRTRAGMGLGPDLLVLPSGELARLAQEGLIQDLAPYELDTSAYFGPALGSLRDGERLYGLPFTLSTMALYYNRTLTETPPATLDALLAEASAGRGVALNTSFYRAFWGIKAFGGQLFDDAGRVVLDQGGFANWLGWLKIAQDNAGVYLGSDPEASAALLAAERVAYYVGASTELPALREALGADLVGVATLPAGPYGAAGPFLETDALALNAASSPAQSELALRLARYLTSVEQQTRLARETARIPANAQVRVDRRINPATATFLAQIETAVPLPNLPQMAEVLAQGDQAYVTALEGVAHVAEAAQQLTAAVNHAHGLTPEGEQAAASCALEGVLRIWHDWEGDDSLAFRQVAQTFMGDCPGVYVTLRRVEAGALYDQYAQAATEGGAPDLLIGPSEWIAPLAEAELLRPLDAIIPPELTQRFLPAANQAASHDGKLYGLPLSLHLSALYYDAERVDNPARTLADLLGDASAERPVALPSDAYGGMWGAAAFGGLEPSAEGRPRLEPDGLARWLDWLRAAGANPGAVLEDDPTALRDLFAGGDVAYLVGDSALLHGLQGRLGDERVRVAPLPSGPAGEARPFLTVDALLLSPQAPDEGVELALAFAALATDAEGQGLLMTTASRVPANVSVQTDAHPAIAGFLEQAKTVVVSPAYTDATPPWEQGDALFADWLAGVEGAEERLQPFVDAVSGAPAEGGQALDG